MNEETKKRGRGRPKKNLYSAKSEKLLIRMTKEEKENLEEKARGVGVSMAEYVRVLLRLR